jgi:protein-disulfide isomerase
MQFQFNLKPFNKILGITFLIIIVSLLAFFLNSKFGFTEKNKSIETSISTNDLDIVFGVDSAHLTIFLYFRYDCVFCQKFFTEVFPQLNADYIKNGKVKLVLKVLELNNDEYVLNSLKTAVCINKYGDLEKLHQLLLTDPNVVYTNEFREVTEGFVEKDIFIAECMLGGKAELYITANALEFKQLGLTGTPTFIINKTIYKGFMKYNELKRLIENELSNPLL